MNATFAAGAAAPESWALGAASLLLAMATGWLAGRSTARRAIGPTERDFVRRTCLILWTLIGLFLATALALPAPYRFVIPALLFFAIPVLMYRWSIRRQLLRMQEERRDRLKH